MEVIMEMIVAMMGEIVIEITSPNPQRERRGRAVMTAAVTVTQVPEREGREVDETT